MSRNHTRTIKRFSDSFEVLRREPGTVVRGRYQRSDVTETFVACGSIQPLNPRDMQRMPEGTRMSGAQKLYTECELQITQVPKTAQEGELHEEPDHIIWNGRDYEIRADDDWSAHGNYFKYYLIKAGQ